MARFSSLVFGQKLAVFIKQLIRDIFHSPDLTLRDRVASRLPSCGLLSHHGIDILRLDFLLSFNDGLNTFLLKYADANFI